MPSRASAVMFADALASVDGAPVVNATSLYPRSSCRTKTRCGLAVAAHVAGNVMSSRATARAREAIHCRPSSRPVLEFGEEAAGL